MDTQKFLAWLADEKHMSKRSAKDVISRYGRICRMLNIDSIDRNSLDHLRSCEEFLGKSTFIKSQLKRTVVLYLEFMDSNE